MRLLITFYILLIFNHGFEGQNQRPLHQKTNKQKLLTFASHKQALFNYYQVQVKSFANYYNIPLARISENKGIVVLEQIVNGHPVFLKTHNVNAAITSGADLLWPDSNLSFNLDGSNVEVGIWDGGSIYQQHQEFSFDANIWQRDTPLFELNHSTHIAGTISADGIDLDSRGTAPASKLLAYDFSNDIAEMAVASSEDLLLSNHSYGAVCGWNYNNETDNWYWYGDKNLNSIEDDRFGRYDSTSWDIDYICYQAPFYLPVKSAGNDRNEGPSIQPVSHFDWNDGWVEAYDIHNLDGSNSGYCSITPKAVAKNNLVIGSIKDLPNGYTTEENVLLETYSAFGPCKDGRIKPDLVANGESLYSCVGDSTNAYYNYSGTSMSTASATGAIALLLQYQEQLSPGVKLLSSTIKAILINTANDCNTAPGPNYKYGWGLLNTYKAALALKQNASSGGACILEREIQQGELNIIPISITENTEQLKLTLCWTDPPGIVDEPTQNINSQALMNNLDITVTNNSTGKIHYPWVLDPTTPDAPATQGINTLDNVEQILIESPLAGDYTIKLSGTKYNTTGYQAYSLVIDGHNTEKNLYPPTNLRYRIGDKTAYLFWNPPVVSPPMYNIYCNKQLIACTDDTCITISSLLNQVNYQFQVKAEYFANKESQASNSITVTPLQAYSTPIIYDFETGLEGCTIKEKIDGWRLGTKDSLTSYYLNFEENTGSFLWIDSGINTWHSHVTDVASTPPLDLEGQTDIKVNFDYVFVTNIYDVIDELHVVYRQVGDDEWIKLKQPSASSLWQQASITLPPDAAKTNTQIGFYYDDYYLHGMGAAIDNVEVTSTPSTSISNYDSAFYLTQNNHELSIFYSIDNKAECFWYLYDLIGRKVSAGHETLINGSATIHVNKYITGIYLFQCNIGNQTIVKKVFLPQ